MKSSRSEGLAEVCEISEEPVSPGANGRQELGVERLRALNRKLERLPTMDRLAWAVERYGDSLVMSTSFGIHSAVMLHLATRFKPKIPVIFIDTGYLFPETYRFAKRLTDELDLNVKKYLPVTSSAEHEALSGRLWLAGEEGIRRYNFHRKVEPMNRAVTEHGARAWIAGLRREQSGSRRDLKVAMRQNRMLKIHPIIDWSDGEVERYLRNHGLPRHPLAEEGYVSVGDVHSTSRRLPGMRPEETRFHGVKRECGLHEPSGATDYQI